MAIRKLTCLIGKKNMFVLVKRGKIGTSAGRKVTFLRKLYLKALLMCYDVILLVLSNVFRVLWTFQLLVTSVVVVRAPLITIGSIIKSWRFYSRGSSLFHVDKTHGDFSVKNLRWNLSTYSVFLMPW
jgi:hypothetical protein